MAFGFKGTPSFIVGKFRVPGILTMAEFEHGDRRRAQGEEEQLAIKSNGALVSDEGA